MPTPTTLLTVSWGLEQLHGASDGPLRGPHHWLRGREGRAQLKGSHCTVPSPVQGLVPGPVAFQPFQAHAPAYRAHCYKWDLSLVPVDVLGRVTEGAWRVMYVQIPRACMHLGDVPSASPGVYKA